MNVEDGHGLPLPTPLPLAGEEYWGVESRVRLAALSRFVQENSENTAHVEIEIEGRASTLVGPLYWFTYTETGISGLCVGQTDITESQPCIQYLRLASITNVPDHIPRVRSGGGFVPSAVNVPALPAPSDALPYIPLETPAFVIPEEPAAETPSVYHSGGPQASPPQPTALQAEPLDKVATQQPAQTFPPVQKPAPKHTRRWDAHTTTAAVEDIFAAWDEEQGTVHSDTVHNQFYPGEDVGSNQPNPETGSPVQPPEFVYGTPTSNPNAPSANPFDTEQGNPAYPSVPASTGSLEDRVEEENISAHPSVPMAHHIEGDKVPVVNREQSLQQESSPVPPPFTGSVFPIPPRPITGQRWTPPTHNQHAPPASQTDPPVSPRAPLLPNAMPNTLAHPNPRVPPVPNDDDDMSDPFQPRSPQRFSQQ